MTARASEPRAGPGVVTAVAIDGPAGAGKSTVAKAVARALGWRYVDTGAMYRAVALAALERRCDPSDGAGLERLARALDLDVDGDRVAIDGRDVGARIRDADVTGIVSQVSAHPGVRRAMVDRQRAAAQRGRVVMEGRDIGTAVLPDAAVKVFLDATLPERARRRAAQLGRAADDETMAELEASIAARDDADASRPVSPLARSGAAVVIDSTGTDVDDVVDAIADLVRDRDAG